MKNMKKSIILFGAVAIVLLMVSSVSAVSHVNGASVMRTLECMEPEQSLSSESEELISNDLEELLEILDIDGFRGFFTSKEFADYMKSAEIQGILNSQVYLRVFNHEATRDFLNSDIFQDFVNSDEAQIYLDNYFGGDEDNTIPSGVQQVRVAVKMISPMSPIGVSGEGRESIDMVASSGGSAQPNNGFIQKLFEALLVALILWIPLAILYLVVGGIASILNAIDYFLLTGNLLGAAAVGLIIYLVYVGMAVFFPLWFAIYLLSQNPDSSMQMQVSPVRASMYKATASI